MGFVIEIGVDRSELALSFDENLERTIHQDVRYGGVPHQLTQRAKFKHVVQDDGCVCPVRIGKQFGQEESERKGSLVTFAQRRMEREFATSAWADIYCGTANFQDIL